ncbi:HAD hydrolase-like protein [Mammaliicoccus sciuri]|uniref:HAD hydrolase-like protein n=1 Tax=Mammaliicoccus sciuri TaxID=1296 RepID=UPI001F54365E|nr:HAD hydrolase-like protein [Mammaliicoccus sciuri]
MIEQVLDNSNIINYFKFILSLEEFGVYKPDSNGYPLLEENISYNKDEVLFVSSNKWDIVGAQKFGFQTAWVNRNFSDFEYIEVKPDFELQSLYSIKDLL